MEEVILLSRRQVDANINRLWELHDNYGKDSSFEFTAAQKIFAIFDGNIIVAFGILSMPHGFCWMRNAIVDTPYRGRGYQQLIIEARVKYAYQRGIRKVTTAVDQMNVWSLNNLVACGFRFVKGGKLHNGHLYQKLQINL
jgi:GNAT superfamily N-acetyltransferase